MQVGDKIEDIYGIELNFFFSMGLNNRSHF